MLSIKYFTKYEVQKRVEVNLQILRNKDIWFSIHIYATYGLVHDVYVFPAGICIYRYIKLLSVQCVLNYKMDLP